MIVFGIICLVLLALLELIYVYNLGKDTGITFFGKLLSFIVINIFLTTPIIFIAMNLK